MDEEFKGKRAKILGYKPQKENIYNGFLPYANLLDEESEKLFVAIKTNLVKSILAREMRPGCALWTSRLNRYIKIYGFKFSKEDHIALIKLFYELMILPDLEPTRINKTASTLGQLLKKKYLLTRDDLQLDWRPLYELVVKTIEKSKSDLGMYRFYAAFETTLCNTIRACKVYFPASATQEILDEFRPFLCPFEKCEMYEKVHYLELFLPNAVSQQEADISYKLWFDELMDLWDVCHNACTWENNMMWIFSGLARFQMGHIDWTPYVSKIFTRFQRVLQLPVNLRQRQTGKIHKMDIAAIAIWIVCSLHGDNGTFFHLEKLMQSLESYYHSANVGRWTIKLRELLKKLAYYFVQRVHWERYKTPSWDNNVPDHYKLTDAEIDRFVNILKPCIENAIYSRLETQDVTLALSYLASLRPKLIIPPILEKMYSYTDSLTEPHRLTSTMMAVIAVGRYMVQGTHNDYPEGPTHVIPLLMSLLPGIDPNDMKKTFVTFNFIVHFCNMIPLIDSSKAFNFYEDLTEEEHMICEASAEFEDFVLQFFDRLIVWVDSNSLDFVRLEQMTSNNNGRSRETMIETALATVVSTVLSQSSPKIFSSALRKFYNFINQKILEIQVAGKMVAAVAHCFTLVSPEETLKVFLPYLFDSIEESLNENPNILSEEHVDDKFLFNMLILSEIVDGRNQLIPYMDKLICILDKTLHMTCLEANQLAAKILELVLTSLSTMRPKESRSSSQNFGSPVEEFLSIREWAKPPKLNQLNLDWYIPKEAEIETIQKLINRYLVPELEVLEKFSNEEIKLTRQQLKCRLGIVNSIMCCHLLLPVWDEPACVLVDSILDSWLFHLTVIQSSSLRMPDGSNVRKAIVTCLHRLQNKLLEMDEGDTLSFQVIIQIYNVILFSRTSGHDFELHWRTFHMVKKIFEDRLHQKKQHLRQVHINRIILQQEIRVESRSCSFTATHKQILEDLIELSVSRYSVVRMAAQSKLYGIIQYFPYSFKLLTDRVKQILQMNSVENHETFKGCLYILLGPKTAPIIARHDWDFIKEIWPLLVKAMPSEKPSIVGLISAMTDVVQKFFPTIAIKLTIPEKTLKVAYGLAATGPFKCDLSGFQKQIDNSEEYLKQRSIQRRLAYDSLVDSLMDNLEEGNLHWRHNSMAISFIKNLVHFDVNYSTRVVRFFLKSLINESIAIRKNAIKVVLYISVQNKPKFGKVEIDPALMSECCVKAIPGERSDNAWMMYNSQTIPKTAASWEEIRYVHNQAVGYYSWPKKLTSYAPASKQKSFASMSEGLSETRKEIYDFFNNEKNIEQLIKYWSFEERKGGDQFNMFRVLIIKNIGKMFEDQFLPLFLPHLKRLVEDKQESCQTCAAELVSGIALGSKHWPFDKVEKMWQNLLPIINTAIVNMSTETEKDWNYCVSMITKSRDPNMIHWLLEFLLDDPMKSNTSLTSCNRLQMLFAATSQQSWRNAEIYKRILGYLMPHLTHPFQLVRGKISQFIAHIFGLDLIFPQGSQTKGPRISDFFEEVSPKFQELYQSMSKKNHTSNTSDIENACDISIVNVDKEKEELLRLFKVVSRAVTLAMIRVNFSARPEFFKMLPLSAVLHNFEIDEEVSSCAIGQLVALMQTMTVEKYIPNVIETIREVVGCPLWAARELIAECLPVFVFYNMPTLQGNAKWVLQIQEIVLILLEDPQPEVRVQAAKVVSGLLHCQFIPQPTELLETFKQKARTKVKKLRLTNENSFNQYLAIRHAGVLGLCSFISAHPYDVPDYLPNVFEALGPHLSDPQPIPATIRSTMGDFKRTHHDNWEMHKLKFTEDQLSILRDLSVPPSYYV